jgi:site-specific recombinase XerD
MESSEFADKSHARQAEIEYSLKHILPVFGPSRLRAITPANCEKFYDILREQGSVHKAARVIKDLRYLFNRAIRQRLIVHNPALAIKVKQPTPRRTMWRADDVLEVIKVAWDEGYRGLAVGISILYDTSMSPVDLRKLSYNDIRGDHTFLERAKSGRGQYAVYSPETIELIASYQQEASFQVLPTTPLVRTRRGRPYSKDRLARDFRIIADKVGLPKNLQMRDLRRTAHTERLEGGAHPQEARAAIGNSVDRNKTLDDTYSVYSLDMAREAERKRREHKTGPKV